MKEFLLFEAVYNFMFCVTLILLYVIILLCAVGLLFSIFLIAADLSSDWRDGRRHEKYLRSLDETHGRD